MAANRYTGCCTGTPGISTSCNDIDKYQKAVKIGEGTYGEVYKARDRQTDRMVALKKIRLENDREGFPITTLREIQILRKAHHENIVQLIEVLHTASTEEDSEGDSKRGPVYLVFEFCDHDLAGLLTQVQFSLGEIKKIMQMLCNGLYYLHANQILHRDIKPANILINKAGLLKLADFGLAKVTNLPTDPTRRKFTNRVVTLWYRAPELLLGKKWYGRKIDMWAVGCIMAELWIRKPLLHGQTEQDQLNQIIDLCGSINSESWPGVESLEYYGKIELKSQRQRRVKEKLRIVVEDSHALDLLDKLLVLDPATRYNADMTLDHDFFWTHPMPVDLRRRLSRLNSLFELTTVRAKRKNECNNNNSNNNNNNNRDNSNNNNNNNKNNDNNNRNSNNSNNYKRRKVHQHIGDENFGETMYSRVF